MKILRASVALVAAGLTLSACATNETGNSSTAGEGSANSSSASLSGTFQGTGASSTKAAQEVWRAEFQKANPNVTINYSPDGSGAGRTAFADGGAAFAGSDRALNDEEMSGTFANCAADTKPVSLPIYISPIDIIVNVDGISELNLDGATIARIFRGEITRWNDPAIAAANPGASLPDAAITPVHRSDNSGTTENFTSTLATIAPDVWTDKPSGDWPDSLPGEAASGTSGVVAAVQNGNGTIGYADQSGVPEGLTSLHYLPANSTDAVAPEAKYAAAIVEASKRVEGREDNDWALNLDRTAAGYPFILVSYAIVCPQYKDPEVGKLTQSYISYVTSEKGQEAAIPQAGIAPLSGKLAENVRKVAESIK